MRELQIKYYKKHNAKRKERKKRFKNRILVLIGSLLGPLLLRFLYNTNKIEIINDNYYEDALKSGKSVIIASWHSTLLTTFMSLSRKKLLWHGK